ncbi:hypothetical protein IV203_030923 [Nitzschia inconspicua]|uniref:Uncharacterized protein n=1 Tax=Nitzschia inconspicua TaxID=303405 RepID=A0A9K3LTD5_9STRA|nr:hypothetical protein IV203_030923 [Nitzschia inconspicua]
MVVCQTARIPLSLAPPSLHRGPVPARKDIASLDTLSDHITPLPTPVPSSANTLATGRETLFSTTGTIAPPHQVGTRTVTRSPRAGPLRPAHISTNDTMFHSDRTLLFPTFIYGLAGAPARPVGSCAQFLFMTAALSSFPWFNHRLRFNLIPPFRHIQCHYPSPATFRSIRRLAFPPLSPAVVTPLLPSPCRDIQILHGGCAFPPAPIRPTHCSGIRRSPPL